MKTTKLTFYERISLWNRMGTVTTANLKEAEVVLRVIAKVRPTDEEARAVKLETTGDGYRWELPEFDYATRTVEFEDNEAVALTKGLENHPMEVRVADAAWMLRVIADLKNDEELLAKRPPKEDVVEAEVVPVSA